MNERAERRGEGEKGEKGRPRRLPALWTVLSGAAAALIAVLLYSRAAGFAYFNDDPSGHFAWMEGQSLLDFFAGSAGYGYYRPVVFAVLRLSELLFGNATFPHNPVADHALLLLLHGANVAMVWALARRLGGRDAYAWVAALVFAFVPFNYEAVAYVASLTHPLLLFWTLLTLLIYDRSQDRRRSPGSGYWSLLPMTLGLLTHENGLFISPALVGLDWARRPAVTWQQRARRLWPFVVPPALFAVVWLSVPKSSEQGLNSLADAARNLTPFLQTLVYPLLPVVRLEAADAPALVGLAAAVVALFGLLARQVGAWRLWVFALGWFGLATLPAALFLGPAYVFGSPRLSYLPSVGAALLWAIPALWAVARRRSAAALALTAACTLAVILPPLPFVRCQMDFYDETSRFARGMAAATAAAAPAGQDVVFVNAPFFFSSTAARPDGCPSPYPWTPVGGVLIPPYGQARDFVRFNGGPDRAVEGVTYAGYAPGWRTFGPAIEGDALRRHAAGDAAYVFDLMRGSFFDLTAAWQPGGAAGETLATYGEALELSGVEFADENDRLRARLAWRVTGETAAPLAAFVHVYDAAGALVAQSDGPPGGGLAPQALWRPGDGLADERVIELGDLPPGTYTIAVGVYDAASGARLPATAGGRPLTDDVYRAGTLER